MNSETPQFRAHCERLIGLLPELANNVIRRTLDALRAPKGDLAVAADRQLVFGVASQIQQHQLRFHEALTHRFQTEVAQARQARPTSQDPSEEAPAKSMFSKLDELSLVDESAAQATIEVARTVQLIDLVTEWSLREFQSYTAALRGDPDNHAEANLFSPAAFARALSDAVSVLQLPGAERQLLLRVGCTVRVARGGVQAVAQWEQGGIDLILMDVQMPGMSGLQATQERRGAVYGTLAAAVLALLLRLADETGLRRPFNSELQRI